MNKCFKKAVSLIILCTMLLCSVSANAFYSPGELTMSLGSISLTAGKAEEVEFYLPFSAGSITYTLSDETAAVTLTTERQSIALGDSSVTMTDATVIFPQVEREGSCVWTLTSDKDAELTDIVIHRYNDTSLSGFGKNYQPPECELTEEELAVSTALIINLDASCIIVGGARRYIDYLDPMERPEIIDGSVYLPARALALALGCYSEVIPSRNYVFVRDDKNSREFYFTATDCYEQTERGTKKTIAYHAVFRDGEAYLPVRCLGELLGKKVEYKDRIIVVDESRITDEIIDRHFDYAVSLFEGFTVQQSTGTTYHVAQTDGASDSNNGALRTPFRTLERACQAATAGDTVIIHEGVYREELKPQNNGTPNNPIVFKAAEGERVVISATEKVSGFASYDSTGKVYAKPKDFELLEEGRNQVFYKDTAIAEARYPDADSTNTIKMSDRGEAVSELFPIIGADIQVQERTSAEESARTAIATSDTLLNQEDNYWQGGTYLSVHGYSYSLSSGKIASSTKGQLNLVETPHQNEYWYNPSTNTTWNFGYITGHINAISQPGEWVVKDGKLIMLPPRGESASSLEVEMKARQLVIDLKDREYVQIHGIETFGGSARMNNSKMCVLSDMDMKYISHYTQSADQREGYLTDPEGTLRQNAKEEPCEPQRGEVGIYISGRDNAVINSRIDHSAAAALYLTGLYTYVDNNIMSNCGYMGSYVSGITVYPDPWMTATEKKGGHAIYNNTVYNCGRHPFKLQSLETTGSPAIAGFLPVEVAYNDFHDGNLFTLDTGMVYVYCVNAATSRQKSAVHSNYVYSTTPESNPYSFGIYFDGGSMGFDAYSNMVFTTEPGTKLTNSYLYRNATKSDCTFANNSQLKKPIDRNVADMDASQFPKGKPFYAGALDVNNPYLMNYLRMDETVSYYKAKDAALGGTAVTESDGGVTLTDSTATLCFSNVDLTGVNQINIYFGADHYGTHYVSDGSSKIRLNDLIRVVIGDSANAANACEMMLHTEAEGLHEPDFVSLPTDGAEGVNNIYITMSRRNHDSRIYGIMLSDDAEDAKPHDGTDINATKYNRLCTMGGVGSTAYTRINGDHVMNTKHGTLLKYRNVVVDSDANVLRMSLSSEYKQKVKIYVGSADTDPIATFTTTKTAFGSRAYEYLDLNKTLTAGTYDIYVKFDSGSSTSGATSDFYSFGFIPEMPQA